MGLTIREKDHWRIRIESRIKNRIESLIASKEPGFRKRIEDAARKEVFATSGTASQFDRLEEMEFERESAVYHHLQLLKRLYEEKENIYRLVGQQLNVTDIRDHNIHHVEAKVEGRLRELTKTKARELMQVDLLGQKVLELEGEQDQLLDTVWLATSPSQIKELWAKLSELLEQTPTQLQKDALEIKPMDTDSQ